MRGVGCKRGSWGGIAGQCCPLCYRALQGGIAATLSQITVEWVTKVRQVIIFGRLVKQREKVSRFLNKAL